MDFRVPKDLAEKKMDLKVAPQKWPQYKSGQKVEVELLQYLMKDTWQKATIIKPIEAADCYEVEYENGVHGIAHAYRLREAD